MIPKYQFDELLRLTRLIEWHHTRLVSPPRGVSVAMWETSEALSIARLTAEMRPLLRSVVKELSQSEMTFGAHPVDASPSSSNS